MPTRLNCDKLQVEKVVSVSRTEHIPRCLPTCAPACCVTLLWLQVRVYVNGQLAGFTPIYYTMYTVRGTAAAAVA